MGVIPSRPANTPVPQIPRRKYPANTWPSRKYLAGGADHAVRAGADHVAKRGEQLQQNGLGLGLGVRSQGAHGFSGESIERVFVEYGL